MFISDIAAAFLTQSNGHLGEASKGTRNKCTKEFFEVLLALEVVYFCDGKNNNNVLSI